MSNTGTADGVLGLFLRITDEDGGANPEPELDLETIMGKGGNDADLLESLELIIVYGLPAGVTGSDLLAVVDGAADYNDAAALLDAYFTSLLHIPTAFYAGMLHEDLSNKLDEEWKTLDPTMAGGEAGDLVILVHSLHQEDPVYGDIDNILMGDVVTVDKAFRLQQTCAGDTGLYKMMNLPSHVVTATFKHWGAETQSYFRCDLSGVGYDQGDPTNPYNVGNGRWVGWCIDDDRVIYERSYDVILKSSLDPSTWNLDGDWSEEDFNCVNWLLNAYPQQPDGSGGWNSTTERYTGTCTMQWAIWGFLDGKSYSVLPAAAKALYDEALLHDDFKPGQGQWALVVCYEAGAGGTTDSHNIQLIGIEVDP
jgi:hypothetical protein